MQNQWVEATGKLPGWFLNATSEIPVWVPDSPSPISNPPTPEKTEMTGRSLPEAWQNIDVDQLLTANFPLVFGQF